MFKNEEELKAYVLANYPEVTDQRIDQSHWDLLCSTCKVARGFQVIRRYVGRTKDENYGSFYEDNQAPVTYLFRCPVCKAFKQWIVYELNFKSGPGLTKKRFKVTSVPSEGLEEITELPEEPASLRIAYREAIRAMDANANIAAAAMFRRAVQVITRDILGTTRGGLAGELRDVQGKIYNGATISSNFASIGYVLKVAGDQAAHPDEDPDLLDFTPEDAADLQRIFMELVSELFVIPAAARKAKEDFLARRKISAEPKLKAAKPSPTS